MASASSCRSGTRPARSASAPSPPHTTAAPWASFSSTTSLTSAPLIVRPSLLSSPATVETQSSANAVLEARGCEAASETPGLTPSDSLADIRTWFQNVEQHATEGVNKILIGNKCDWEEKRVVSQEKGQALADELGIPFLEVSAKSNINIDKAFYSLAADIKKRLIDNSKNEQSTSSGVNVSDKGEGGFGSKCC